MSQRVFVNLGEVYFGQGEVQVETLLGSCVAITLWHPGLRMGGLCHFVLPMRPQRQQLPEQCAELDGRYGEDALLRLLQEVRKHDTQVTDYVVKVFGGGRILGLAGSRTPIGQANVSFALAMLRRQQVQITAQDVAGEGYRYLRFDLHSGDVWVRHGYAGQQELEKLTARAQP